MIITQTPLRISFAGGGTDLAAYYAEREGFVVSTAIDKFVYVIVKERFDDADLPELHEEGDPARSRGDRARADPRGDADDGRRRAASR